MGIELARSVRAFERGEKRSTVGRRKKPTVGRRCDLPWVGQATYRRFFSAPSVSPLRNPLRERLSSIPTILHFLPLFGEGKRLLLWPHLLPRNPYL